MKKLRTRVLFLTASILLLGACSRTMAVPVYWQRIEDNSALYMTGPKAQQILHQNIATCVRQLDELVELDAIRRATPPDTHTEYHRALNASGDLAYYDTPTRYNNRRVLHTDFHDFESCMRYKGWERVKYLRYQTEVNAQLTDMMTEEYRETGAIGDAALIKERELFDASRRDYRRPNRR